MKQNKDQRVHLRLTAQQKEAGEKLAEKQGLSLSQFIRNYLVSKAKREGLWR